MDHVPVGYDTQGHGGVRFERASRQRGIYVLGRPESGKSNLLYNLAAADIIDGHGIAVLDPHGSLVRELIPWTLERPDDVIILDCGDGAYPFGLNLFQCDDPRDPLAVTATVDSVVGTFEKVWGIGEQRSWGPALEDLLRNITHVMIANPGYTLAEVPDLLYEEAYRHSLLENVSNPLVHQFWEYDYPKASREQREARRSTINKVRAFLLNEVVAGIVSQSRSSVNFAEVVSGEKVLLVNLRRDVIRDEAVTLLGTTIMGKLMEAAFSRGVSSKLFYLYADEFHRFATPDFAVAFDELRKFGIALTVAHQRRLQLDGDVAGAALNAGTVVAFGMGPDDANAVSELFDATTEEREIIGTRPKLEPARDPWRELESRGHTEPQVMEPYFAIKATTSQLREYAEWYSAQKDWETRKWLVDNIQHREVDVFMRGIDDAIRAFFIGTRGQGSDAAMEFGGRSMRLIHRNLPGWYAKHNERRTDEYKRLLTSLSGSMIDLWDKLRAYPIYTQSGDVEPIYGPRRMVSDTQAEIANKIVNLPNHIAMMRLAQRTGSPLERRVHLYPGVPPPPEGVAKVAFLRQRSREMYSRPRQDVEASMRQRRQRSNLQDAPLTEELPDPRRRLPLD